MTGRRPTARMAGAAGLVVVLLATSLVLLLRPEEPAAEPAGVVGTVIAAPCQPVESPGDPPCPGYVGEIRVLREDGSLVTTAHTDRGGHFRVELPPGRYIVDPGDGGKSLANGEGRVTVREGAFSRVDLTYYTGLL